MSVAFRREDDDEHKEPKFEIPIAPGPNLVTARGLRLLRERLAASDAAIADASADTIEALRREQRYWATRVSTAELAPDPAPGEAGIGTHVRFRLNGQDRSAGIVGGDEADPAAGLIAFSAPLARALAGGMAGDVMPFNGSEDAIEILAVERLELD